ncbi:MAG TPA: GntR family transcriptional regulator [bacterium]|nr:GntR family transcriptional regulator [bacterium]
MGLVQLKPHQGAFVARLSQQDVREIFDIRQALETHAAKKVHAAFTPDSADRLKRALAEIESAARDRDVARCTNADRNFHRTLCELAGNHHLTEILNDLTTRFFAYELIRDLRNPGGYQFKEKVAERRELLRLILGGTDREIEGGFSELFAGFLNHVLTRLMDRVDAAPIEAGGRSAN